MNFYTLQDRVTVSGRSYELDWHECDNLNGFRAEINIGKKFETEEDADIYLMHNWGDFRLAHEIGTLYLYADGTLEIVDRYW